MKKTKLIISLTLLLVSSNLYAAGYGTGKVTLLAVNAYDQVLVETSIPGTFKQTTKPECSTAERYVADITTEHGKAMYSLLLAAQAQDLDIVVGGKNSCNIRTGYESIQYVTLIK